jgi:hypothetical protein
MEKSYSAKFRSRSGRCSSSYTLASTRPYFATQRRILSSHLPAHKDGRYSNSTKVDRGTYGTFHAGMYAAGDYFVIDDLKTPAVEHF